METQESQSPKDDGCDSDEVGIETRQVAMMLDSRGSALNAKPARMSLSKPNSLCCMRMTSVSMIVCLSQRGKNGRQT